jgi:2,4-dichlorophenol 6-monooxygenase
MNQRYHSTAILTDGQAEPAFEKDRELHYAPTTWPGARLPHVWVFAKDGSQHSTLDITGHGGFTILTGIGGEAWVKATEVLSKELGIPLSAKVMGPRRDYEDHTGDWARIREISDSGCLLVRPDHHVAWRAFGASKNAQHDLATALKTILEI